MSCLQCGRGLHKFCQIANCLVCHPTAQDTVEKSGEEDDNWHYKARKRSSIRSKGKRDETLRDQQSTGRKRAAIKFPLDRNASCEWRGLRFAGGGKYPIVGCLDGKQQARHHGPDKNTLNNDEGNVHRICHTCHNRWHSRNDSGYEWGAIYRPHNPNTEATSEEIWEAEREWFGVKLVKITED
jgi:hypothetical protein